MDNIRLDGQVAVVTGAGGGLGRTYALELARRGASVVVNDLGGSLDGAGGGKGPADDVVEEIRQFGGTAAPSYASVATPDGGEEIVRAALETFGQIDAVVHNAGILRDKTLGKLDWADHESVLDVHLRGAFHLARPAFNAMREKSYGRFVFVTSNTGLFGNFGQASYGAAKAGVVGLSGVIALEGARYGILSNVIAPLARTRMTEAVMDPERSKYLDPAHAAPMVGYLSSSACGLTHEVMSAGGGRFARVFVGLAPGWQAPTGTIATAEDISAHLDEIRAEPGYIVPASVQDEMDRLFDELPRNSPCRHTLGPPDGDLAPDRSSP